MVTKPQIQEQIAKVRGWTDLKWFQHPDEEPGKLNLVGFKKNGDYGEVPNWPTDRNASYDLLHKMNAVDTRNATAAAEKHYWFILATHPAKEESLIYLWHEGYRWVDCDSCEGGPHGVSEDYTDCNGEDGEWVTVCV